MHDLRTFAGLLEQQGKLVRIRRPVDARFEVPALMEQIEAQRKAFIFEDVRGARFPLVGGLFNDIARFGWALGDPADRPFGHDEMEARLERAKAAPLPVRTVASGPAREVTLTGAGIDLRTLPVPTFFEQDSGPFITAAIGVARNPRTGALNAGFYRTLILGPDTFAINASSLSDLRRFYEHAEANGTDMRIALALGVDPALLFAAAAKLPPTISEFDVAGALQGQPIEMMQALTSDLPVPARAEIIIEGRVDFGRKIENTLGEFAGQYGPETCPVTQVTAITHRRDAMFYSIMAGRNPEHNTIGKIATYGIRREMARRLSTLHPGIRGVHVHMEPGLGSMAHVAIAFDKSNDEEPRALIRDAFAAAGGLFPVSKITKRIIVVDPDIDITNLADVEWATWTRLADAAGVILLPDVPSWELERCGGAAMRSMRIGVDATMAMAERDKLLRPRIPGAEGIHLRDYLTGEGR
jgi:2,5-furandicarboxylate decarboxylase 1